MTENSSLKAFYLYFADAHNDDEGHHEVIFAKSSIAAKKKWSAMHWDGHEIAGICSQRKPHFDCYSPGPVPPLALIHEGWWMECWGCGVSIYEGVLESPVEHGSWIFCSQNCMDHHDELTRKTKRHEARAKKILTDYLLKKLPDAVPVHSHAYAIQDDKGWIIRQVFVDFIWPKSKHGKASIRIDSPYTKSLSEKRRAIFMVPKGDHEDFNAWIDEVEEQEEGRLQ
jgi:hypothetical protein